MAVAVVVVVVARESTARKKRAPGRISSVEKLETSAMLLCKCNEIEFDEAAFCGKCVECNGACSKAYMGRHVARGPQVNSHEAFE